MCKILIFNAFDLKYKLSILTINYQLKYELINKQQQKNMTTSDRILHFIATKVETSEEIAQNDLVLDVLHDSKLLSYPKEPNQENQISLLFAFSSTQNLQIYVKRLNTVQNYGSISFVSDTFVNIANGSYEQWYFIK